MTTQDLIESAQRLVQPPSEVADEFASKRERLASLGNQIMAVRPDLAKMVGKNNRAMAEDNNRNFARFMESLFFYYQPEVLVETVLWVFRAYRSHGFHTIYWPANLNMWVDMLRNELSGDTFEAVYPFYHWLIVNIPIFVALTDAQLSKEHVNQDNC